MSGATRLGKEMKKKKKKERGGVNLVEAGFTFLGVLLLGLLVVLPFVEAVPTGPTAVTYGTNETATATGGTIVNISGGYIANFNLTATTQNPHWKAFVGHIDGRFSLDDAAGSTIYDWSLTSVSGEVYASRNSSTVDWSNIGCANATYLEAEDSNLQHTGEDNINTTFNETNSNTFLVAGTNILAGTCPAINTYVNSAPQSASFEEVALYDQINVVFASILEDDVTGFDGVAYDFQMIVPENGSSVWTGTTAYYIYVELS